MGDFAQQPGAVPLIHQPRSATWAFNPVSLEVVLTGAEICFFATSKSGLGHLRRAATIARAIRLQAQDRVLRLVSNARPEGLEPEDINVFDTIHIADRARMAEMAPTGGPATLVLDTIRVPGIETLDAKRVLVLRQAPADQLHRFRLATGRCWDQIIVANPRGHWMPDAAALGTADIRPVGWIYRPTGPRVANHDGVTTVLVATGGGGTAETARVLYAQIDRILLQVRRRVTSPFRVVQAIGPRALAFGRLDQTDTAIDPGGRLNALFRDADVTISTAGYNSVLELATTDTPALLTPIPRSIDDQVARARLWGAQLGAWHNEAAPDAAVDWLVRLLAHPVRRAPVDLGPSGEDRAAKGILALG